MTKETDGIENDDRVRVRKEQCSDKKDEERKLRGGRAIARKTNGERTTQYMTCWKMTGEKVIVEMEGGQWNRRGDNYMCRRNDEGNKESESKCVEKGSRYIIANIGLLRRIPFRFK